MIRKSLTKEMMIEGNPLGGVAIVGGVVVVVIALEPALCGTVDNDDENDDDNDRN